MRGAKIVTPYTGLCNLSDDSVLAHNFPSCKLLFKMNNYGAKNYLVNSVDGGIWRIQGGHDTPTSNNCWEMVNTAGYQILADSGAEFNVPLDKITVMVVIAWANSNASLGGIDFQRIEDESATLSYSAAATNSGAAPSACFLNVNANSYASVRVNKTAGLTAAAIAYDPGTSGELKFYFVDENGYGAGNPYTANGVTGNDGLTGTDADMNYAYTQNRLEINCFGLIDPLSAITIHMVSILQFDTMPTDTAVALEWMRKICSQQDPSKKAIYPGWAGRR